MTPQEKELISSLMGRLRKAGGEPKDVEAEALIRQSMAEQPDAPYQLVQTVLIQDMALNQAQSRIADLEKQLAEAKARTQPASSFLGGLAGRTGATTPPFGPWGQPTPAPQPNYGQGGYVRPDYAPPAPPPYGGVQGGPGFGGGGFLRSAATTAAGVAGGALLFEGIQSMFGHHADGILSGVPQQPAITETVINNYYGDEPGEPQDYGAQDVDTGPDFQADDGFDSDFGGIEDI
jgi:hypothetical protein